MHLFRRGFYLLIGFTFPGFWMLHASGLMGVLYKPLQLLFHTSAVGWPSLITASLLYLGTIVVLVKSHANDVSSFVTCCFCDVRLATF